MFKRTPWFSFAKNVFREFHKARCQIQRRQDKIQAYLNSPEYLLRESAKIEGTLIREVAQVAKFLDSAPSLEKLPSKPRVKFADSNQFSRNYTQTYSAATKRNGGVRGSKASCWK